MADERDKETIPNPADERRDRDGQGASTPASDDADDPFVTMGDHFAPRQTKSPPSTKS